MATLIPGWHPDHTRRALDRMAAAGRTFYAPAPLPVPSAPISLARHRLRVLDQGRAGTCYTHGAVQAAETTGRANGAAVFPIARRLVAYAATRLAGGGNPADGGSGYDAFAAMGSGPGGVGVAHEDAFAYSDDRRVLAAPPPAAILDDARRHWLDAVIRVPDLNSVAGLIGARHAVSIGIWWPAGWGDPAALKAAIGPGGFGHEVCVDGYAPAGVLADEDCFRVENSWGRIYRPLPQAPDIPGEDPADGGAASGFWVLRSRLETVLARGGDGSELVTMTSLGNFGPILDIDGLAAGDP